MKKQYTWKKSSEMFEDYNNATFDSVVECIIDAIGCGVETGKTIYIGECVPYDIRVDASGVLEDLQELAINDVGDTAQDWDIVDYQKDAEIIKELSQELTVVIQNWLKKYHREPHFYDVENVKEYVIREER